MNLRLFLYKIKEDGKRIFARSRMQLDTAKNVDYAEYWKKRGREGAPKLSSWQKERAEYTSRIIENNTEVLDIGCGDGAILSYLREQKNIRGIGIDLEPEILALAEQLGFKTLRIDLSNPTTWSALPETDYVLAFEILEHIPNPEAFLEVMRGKTKKAIIISFPNSGYYVHRLRLLFGKFPQQWIHHPGEHLRYWTVADAKWWAMSLNFFIDQFTVYQGIPLLNRIFPSVFGQGIFLVLKNKQ